KNRRANRQLRPPGGNRRVGIMNERGVSELHYASVLVPELYFFPKAFTKSQDDAQDITHCEIIDRCLFLWRQIRNKSHGAMLKHTQRQRDDGAGCVERELLIIELTKYFDPIVGRSRYS